jgi:hypothetical protein
MAIQRAPWLGLLLAVLVASRAHSEDRYFKADFHTGAHYLKLSVDGTYETIDREHMGVWVAERGHWSEEPDSTLVFVSDDHVKDVVTPVGRVVISGPEGPPLMASLRIMLSRLIEEGSPDEYVLPSALDSLGVASDAGRVDVELDPAGARRGVVSRDELQSLANAMDRYLLSQLRHVSRRRLETHRGVTFLVSLGDGVRAPVSDSEEIRTCIDELDGRAPAYALVEIKEDVFKCELETTYPFRFLRPTSCARTRSSGRGGRSTGTR